MDFGEKPQEEKKKNLNEKYRSNLASHLILFFFLVLWVCCGRNSLQVIYPVTVGRCNPLAVTPAKISLLAGDICSGLVPSHREEVHGKERSNITPCNVPWSCFQFPRHPMNLALKGGCNLELESGEQHRLLSLLRKPVLLLASSLPSSWLWISFQLTS